MQVVTDLMLCAKRIWRALLPALLLSGCEGGAQGGDVLADLRALAASGSETTPATTSTSATAAVEVAATEPAPRLADLLGAVAQGRYLNPFQPSARGKAASPVVNIALADCAQAPPESHCIKDGLISLNYTETDLRSLLQQIAYAAEANILISDEVEGKITLNLRAVPWRDALRLVMTNKDLAGHSTGGVMLIGPSKAVTEQQEAALLRQRLEEQLAPLETEYIQVLHAKAADIAALLTGGDTEHKSGAKHVRPLLSERGHLLVDTRTNGIILTDTLERFAVVRQLLAQIDKPVRQVMVEARIVTANTNFSKQIGVSWGGGGQFDVGLSGPLGISGSRAGLTGLRTGGRADAGGLIVDLGVPESSGAGFAVGLIGSRFMLDLELSALISEGEGDVVARPKIVTADKQSATIISGVEVPFQENSTSGATSTSFKQAVMALEVLPHITPDDRISMDLKVSQDSIGGIVGNTPLINTNQINTKVLVQDGQTVVLGGVFRLSQSKTITKTPLLGDIPVIQLLFRRVRKIKEKQELLIFITPKIVEEMPSGLAKGEGS